MMITITTSKPVFSSMKVTGIKTTLILILSLLLTAPTVIISQSILTRSITQSSDDAEEEGTNGSYNENGAVYLTGIYLELSNDAQNPGLGTQTLGLRFNNIAIPKNAIINEAHLVFRSIEPDSNNDNISTTKLTIYGNAEDNASTFVGSSSGTFTISKRPITKSSINWTPSPWELEKNYNSPDLKSIIQEIINRPGWTSNNSIAFIIKGQGSRSAESWDDAGTNPPQLVISYGFSLDADLTNVKCKSESTGSINLTVTGGTPPYTYNWSNGTTQEDPKNLTVGVYYLTVTDATGAVSTGNFEITEPKILLQPLATQSLCKGGNTNKLSLALPTDITATFQWYSAQNATDPGSVIAGATALNYTPDGSTPGTFYYYNVITIPGCPSFSSNKSTVTVAEDPYVITQPTNATICKGQSYLPGISAGGGSPQLTYQWQYSVNGSTGWANVVNGTPANAVYTSSTSSSLFKVNGNLATGSYYYRCVMSSSGSGCNPVTSNNGILTIVDAPVIKSQPAGATICSGYSYTPTISIEANNSQINYQWQYSVNGTTGWANVSDGTPSNAIYKNTTSASGFTVDGKIVEGTYFYRCVISNGSTLCSTTSNTVTLKVNSNAIINTQPANTTICVGGTYYPGIVASNGSSSLNYQWQYSNNGYSGWANVVNGTPTNATYSNPTNPSLFYVTGNILPGKYYYRCVISSSIAGCGSINSIVGVLTVIESLKIEKQPLSAKIYTGESYSPKIEMPKDIPGLSYQWEYSKNSKTGWINVTDGTPSNATYSGSTANLFTIGGDLAEGLYYYRCIVTANSKCNAATSKIVTLKVTKKPKPGDYPISTRSNESEVNSLHSSLIISPNPANDHISLIIENTETTLFDCYIYDSKGQQVLAISNSDQKRIDITQIPSGLYYVKVISGAQVLTGKFIK